jgi:hypothetical protein
VTEVKKCPAVIDGAQWEVLEYFKEYMEDYNTVRFLGRGWSARFVR